MTLNSQIWHFAKWQPCSVGKKPQFILEVLDDATKRRPNGATSLKTRRGMALKAPIRADFRFSLFYSKYVKAFLFFGVGSWKWARSKLHDDTENRLGAEF